MKRITKKLGLLVVGVTSLSLAACSGGTTTGGSSASTGGDDQITIGASLLTQSHPFYNTVREAMESQAKTDGVDLTISIADQDLNKQIAQVEDFINRNVDVIVLSPVDSDGVVGAIKKAEDAGIPVVTVDVPANGVEVASHVATDNYHGGMIAAAAMSHYINDSGNIGLITYPEVQSVRDRIDGFKAELANHPNMKVAIENPGRDRAAALKTSEDMLTSNPDLAGIFGFGDDMALAATQAVKDANSNAVVIGFDGMAEAKASVDQDNAFKAVVVQDATKMGEVAVTNSEKIAKGEDVEKTTPITPTLYANGQGDVPVTIDGDKITINW